jgi:hypothetical protein
MRLLRSMVRTAVICIIFVLFPVFTEEIHRDVLLCVPSDKKVYQIGHLCLHNVLCHAQLHKPTHTSCPTIHLILFAGPPTAKTNTLGSFVHTAFDSVLDLSCTVYFSQAHRSSWGMYHRKKRTPHARTHAYRCVCTHARTHARMHTHTHTHTQTHKYLNAYIYTQTHTHSHTHTHTPTHTHTNIRGPMHVSVSQ